MGPLPIAGTNSVVAGARLHATRSPSESHFERTATVRIPAPVETLFLSDGSTVSSSNLLASGLLAVLAANMYISDGEQINTALDNGFIKGNKISKAKKLKNT
jgi:hypothetical protein